MKPFLVVLIYTVTLCMILCVVNNSTFL